MIHSNQSYTRFTIQLTNGDMITTDPAYSPVHKPASATVTPTHVHVMWADGDISRYPDRAVAEFTAHNPHKTEQS